MFPAIKGYFDKGRIFLTGDAPVTDKTTVIITFLLNEEKKAGQSMTPQAWGSLGGRIIVSDEFDEPLRDLKDYM